MARFEQEAAITLPLNVVDTLAKALRGFGYEAGYMSECDHSALKSIEWKISQVKDFAAKRFIDEEG